MVNVLWERGDVAASMQLDDLFDPLAEQEDIAIFCSARTSPNRPASLDFYPSIRPMKTACPRCHATLETSFIMLGAQVECPACRVTAVPDVLTGTQYPRTGYEMTFRDFCHLFTDPSNRPHVRPFLQEWYGYDARLVPGGFSFVGKDSVEVPPLAVHQIIQSDAPRQYALYQAAMNLWR
ncbi:MAG: hypothetical protein ABI910_02895 [Gemmatimonadota bacterium]